MVTTGTPWERDDEKRTILDDQHYLQNNWLYSYSRYLCSDFSIPGGMEDKGCDMSLPHELKKAIEDLLEMYNDPSPDSSYIWFLLGKLQDVYLPIKDK